MKTEKTFAGNNSELIRATKGIYIAVPLRHSPGVHGIPTSGWIIVSQKALLEAIDQFDYYATIEYGKLRGKNVAFVKF